MCKLPVTSIKIFSKFVNQVAQVLKTPTFGVVVELSVTPNPATIFQVNWKVLDQVSDETVLQALLEKHEASQKLLFQPYPKMDDEPAPPASKSTKY